MLARQSGVFTRAQAVAAGCTDSRIRAHIAAGRWQRVHLRVYCATTGQLSRHQQLWAALLYAGEGAVLSYETAAELFGLTAPHGVIHVTVPAHRQVRSTRGIRIHRSGNLDRSQVHPALAAYSHRANGSGPSRRGRHPGWRFRSGCGGMCQRRLTTPTRLADALTGRPSTRWRALLGPALQEIAAGSHSLLEHKFVTLSRRHGLLLPARQVRLTGDVSRRLDADYHPLPVRVELDGLLGHDRLLERWRRRDNAATIDRKTVLRYGWADVTSRSCAVAAQVGSALIQRGWAGRLRTCGNECELGRPSVTTSPRLGA